MRGRAGDIAGVVIPLAMLGGCASTVRGASEDAAVALAVDAVDARPDRVEPPAPSVSVSVGENTSCRIDARGQLWCWGANHLGFVRPGVRTVTEPRQRAVTGLDDVAEVAVTRTRICAVRRSGRLACWGSAILGPYADGGPWDLAPRDIPGLSGIVAVSIDDQVLCAGDANHQWWCWGDGSVFSPHLRALLPAGRADRAVDAPTMAPALSGASRVALSVTHGAAVYTDGSVRRWAFSIRDPNNPALGPEPIDGVRDAVDVAATTRGVCVLRASGEIACADTSWPTGALRPVPDLRDAAVLTNDGYRFCALRRGGGVLCWSLGIGGADGAPIFEELEALADVGPSVAIAGARERLCAIALDGRVACRGRDRFGELGRGTSITMTRATEVPGIADVSVVRAMRGRTREVPNASGACALHRDGGVSCWGTVIGAEDADRARPTRVVGVSDIVELRPPCGRRRDGRIVCWTRDRWGAGASTRASHEPLYFIEHTARDVRQFQLDSSDFCGCLLDGAGALHCWRADMRARPIPRLTGVASFALYRRSLSAEVGCAHFADGEHACWRSAVHDVCGSSVPDDVVTPAPVPALRGSTQSTQDGLTRCARMPDGRWRCVDVSELGAGEVWPSGEDFDDDVQVEAGFLNWCGRSSVGAVRCLGSNYSGSLGTNFIASGRQVALARGTSDLAPLDSQAWCAVRDGQALCWGENDHGELGLGTWGASFPMAPIVEPEP